MQRTLTLVFALLLAAPTALWAQNSNRFQFQHTPPTSAPPSVDLTLRCKAEENDELEQVYLYYRQPGWSRYRLLPMKLSGGIIYTATIPGAQVQKPALIYFILAIDTQRKKHFLFGSATRPHRLTIKQSRKPDSRQPPQSRTPSKPDPDDDAGSDEGTVYSASRREQRIQMAPSVVTVITSADIKSNGWRTLMEILRHVVGIDINNNGHWADIGIRGVNPRVSYGDKLIILLDGHNMAWRQFNRNYLSPSWVTVDNIKRIEIIRGPGSALWGANAISGVINIITKVAQDLKGLQVTAGASPLSQTHFLTLQGGQSLGNGIVLRASFSLHRENRSPILSPIREFLALDDSDFQKLNKANPGVEYQPYRYVPVGDSAYSQNFYALLSWRGVSLRFHQSRYDPQAPMSTFSQLGGDDSRFVTDRYFVKASWATPLRSWGTLFVWASFDYYRFADGTVYESNPLSIKAEERTLTKMAARDARFEAGGQFSAQLFSNDNIGLSLIAGADYEFLNLMRWHFPEVWTANSLPTPNFSNHHASAFLQAQVSFVQKAHLTVGGRFDIDSVYGAILTPRAAFVFTPGYGFYAKALYGNAFKAPSYHDLYYFRANAFYGNRNVKPESVHTFEAQIGWQRNRLLAVSLNGYLSLFRDLIAYAQRQKTDTLVGAAYFPPSQLPDGKADFSQKDNTTDLTIFGGELEFRLFLVRGLSVLGSFGLFFGHNGPLDAPTGDLLYSAGWKGSLAASYRFKAGPVQISLALGAVLTGSKRVPPKAYNPSNARFDIVGAGGQRLGVPFWTGSNADATAQGIPFDPTLATPLAIRTYATVQVLGILKHFDLVLRATNLLNRDNYDANDLLLYPQERFDLMAWLRVKY